MWSTYMLNTLVAAMMNDLEMAAMEMPFDGTRMIYGGFEAIVEA